MWFDIIRVFDSANRRGPFLRTCCRRHPSHYLDVFHPAQFEEVEDCNVRCGDMMECGIHGCPLTCHPESHDRIPCRATCEKALVCGHTCTKLCFEECGRCKYALGRQQLPCGHEAEILCSGRMPKCHAFIKEAVMPCGHVQTIQCSERERPLVCHERCDTVLDCGHRCPATCEDCSTADSHPPCSSPCHRKMDCGHFCGSVCHFHHGGCPPCDQQCRDVCPHGPCKGICGKVCDPCVKTRKPTCKHEQPQTICSLPSDQPICMEPCLAILSCAHVCPSLCNAECPQECFECKLGTFSSDTVVLMPKCSHQVAPATPSCPCQHFVSSSVSGHRGYAKTQKEDVETTFDRLLAKLGRKLDTFGANIAAHEQTLAESFHMFCSTVRPNCLAATANRKAVAARIGQSKGILAKIVAFQGK